MLNRIKNSLIYRGSVMWQKLSFAMLKKHGKVVIFLVPGSETKGGGILSIFAIYRETLNVFMNDKVSIFIMSYPNSAKILKYTWFENDVIIYPFDFMLSKKFQGVELLVHIPEYYVAGFFDLLTPAQVELMSGFKNVHFNIMNQNIELMPSKQVIDKLRRITDQITSTTAHDSYTNSYFREYYGLPIHKLSSWFDKDEIVVIPYEFKEDIMIVSPDSHPLKQFVLEYIKEQIPELQLVVIYDMKYEDYKLLEAKAKWSVSFGEGLDGYVIGPTLRGGIGFAIYNKDFFTQDFIDIPNIFDEFDEFAQNIVAFIKDNDNKNSYENTRSCAYNIIHEKFNYNDFKNNIKLFYEGQYTLP